MANKFIPKVMKAPRMSEPEGKSKGIVDDFAVRKNVATREGTIEKVPSADNHITNKKYVDDAISGVAPGSTSNYTRLPLNQIEFLNVGAGSAGRTSTWNALAVGGATQAQVTTASVNHPGVMSFLCKAGTPNTGYCYMMDINSIKLGSGGEKSTFIFQIVTDVNTTTRLGFFNVITANPITDGVWLNIDALNVTGRTIDSLGGNSTTGTSYNLTANVWYRGVIDMTDLSVGALFEIYAEGSTTRLWGDNLTSNIPSTAVGHGCMAYNSGLSSLVLIHMDYMDFVCSRTLSR